MAWRLRRAAVRLRAERIAIGQLLDAHGPGSHGTLLITLAAACVLPVPGLGTVLGFGIAALAWSMWRGAHAHALPERVARLTMPRIWARRALALLARVHVAAARLSRPRLGALAAPGQRRWMALLIGWLALLVILPIPFGNVLPSIALALLGIGLLFRDGLLVVAALASAALATMFPVALILAAAVWGPEALGALTPEA